MFGFFDESGKPALTKNTLFVVTGVWSEREFLVERMMRDFHRELRFDGYIYSEVKGSCLNSYQKKDLLNQIAKDRYPFFTSDIHVLKMNSLIDNFNLFSPHKWNEREIHQSLLYSMICNKVDCSEDTSYNIYVDVRYTLPKEFFVILQSALRKKYSRKMISISRETSHARKGIQLADFFSNIYFSSIELGSSFKLDRYISLRILNSAELVSILTTYKSLGGV
jgi:hypothetical protein